MGSRQAFAVTLLGIILVACGSGTVPAPPPPVGPTDPGIQPSAAAEVSPTSTAAPVISEPSASLSPTPAPTKKPPPKRPTGMRIAAGYYSCDGATLGPEDACEEFPTGDYRVTWKAPRAKGLVVRIYGVTECLATDVYGAWIDGGWCLRQDRVHDIAGTLGVDGQQYLDHGPIQDAWLVPLARAKAPKGTMVFDFGDYQMGYFSDPADPDHATALYAIVAAVYDANGQRSPFTVVYSSHLCEAIQDLDCPEAVDSQLGYYPVR